MDEVPHIEIHQFEMFMIDFLYFLGVIFQLIGGTFDSSSFLKDRP